MHYTQLTALLEDYAEAEYGRPRPLCPCGARGCYCQAIAYARQWRATRRQAKLDAIREAETARLERRAQTIAAKHAAHAAGLVWREAKYGGPYRAGEREGVAPGGGKRGQP